MLFKDMPIQKKLMRIIFLISGAVLLVTCITFFIYEFYAFRKTTIEKLSTIGKIIVANSTAILAFDDRDGAKEILAALKTEPHIVAAALYDEKGNLFSQYPESLAINNFPASPGMIGFHFSQAHLEGFQPLLEGTRRFGTLYLKSDLKDIYERFRLYGIITILAIALSLLFAYLLSKIFQKSISNPILALAETAKTISVNRDYSLRAVKSGNDEMGFLTDSFNNMLGKIHEQNQALGEFNEELARNEKKYRYLFENSPMPMWVIDLNTFKFLDVNEMAILQYGYSRQEFLSMTTLDIRPDDDKELFKQPEHLLEMTRTNYSKGIWRHMKKDGTIIQAETIGHKIIFEGVIARLILSNDVTEKIKAGEEIKKLNEELENRVKLRTEELEAFSYSVSHDLRAPLRAVNGFAKMLEEDYKKVFDNEGNRLLGVIQKNAKKMGILIDDLLAFSRLGKKEVSRSLIDMTQLSKNIFSEMEKTFSNKVNIKINPLYPVMADYSLINLVMTNLISNAIKYSSEKEKPSVEIKSERKNGELIYSVSDNGAGFDMQYEHKLFGVFQRLHSEEEFEGTGVGLAIVKRIINKHNGRVWAEGETGKGATFYFSLQDYETIKNN